MHNRKDVESKGLQSQLAAVASGGGTCGAERFIVLNRKCQAVKRQDRHGISLRFEEEKMSFGSNNANCDVVPGYAGVYKCWSIGHHPGPGEL